MASSPQALVFRVLRYGTNTNTDRITAISGDIMMRHGYPRHQLYPSQPYLEPVPHDPWGQMASSQHVVLFRVLRYANKTTTTMITAISCQIVMLHVWLCQGYAS